VTNNIIIYSNLDQVRSSLFTLCFNAQSVKSCEPVVILHAALAVIFYLNCVAYLVF